MLGISKLKQNVLCHYSTFLQPKHFKSKHLSLFFAQKLYFLKSLTIIS